ncbi:DMT family transporter [Marinicella sp. S1101]|uniref:DMT family transporter n=1 Tax=Marinicella marina TaxID=2996016 RepID=UPI002260E97D|nr:DMT family transporter [Marinicella marina]MCX7553146.1 DMT family transporter [Marinicella marina]MDJ1138878.1 DMT family transporter [Marinicella marina]
MIASRKLHKGQLLLLTLLALLAFAANSVLCRMALADGLIDPAGFTTIRLVSGALALVMLWLFCSKNPVAESTYTFIHFCAALALFTYALLFSLAYVQLQAGAGALVLFGAVQITLILLSILQGKMPHLIELFGIVLAFSGLVYLLYPEWGTPTLMGFVMMLFAGVAWGVYTWLGKGSKNPVHDTRQAFIGCVPLVAIMALWWFMPEAWTVWGVVLAVVSGALTSAMGYAIWYVVLPRLTVIQAGVIQLMVPVIAALAGVFMLNESITQRLVLASLLVLGGVYLVLLKKAN